MTRSLFTFASGLCALLLAACATPNPYALGELPPTSTVASGGDFLLEADHDKDIEDQTERTHQEHAGASTGLDLIAPKTLSEPFRLLVQPTPNLTTQVQLTPLTLGEAIFFASGHHTLNIPGAKFEISGTDETSLDLSLLARYSPLLALHMQTINASGEVVGQHHQLLQLTPFKTSTSTHNETLSVQLSDRFTNTPIAGAEVEVINAEGQHLERGSTNRNGRIEIPVPAAVETLFGPALFLTIQHGHHVAFIEL